ncbi:MAG: hypothetical protein ABJB74_11620 [Gemmatimonas sp.]
MRILLGLFWALVGGVVGFIVVAVGASLYAGATHMSGREGARGYFVIGLGLVGAVVGLITALVLYGRSAPAGQGAAYSGSGVLGFVGLVAAIAVSLWAYMQLMEKPLEYGGSMASLDMEFRVKSSDLPPDASGSWLNVEVQTAKTRPEGSVSWNSRRIEGVYTIIPVSQGGLYRATNRVIVVRVGEEQVEAFIPPMKRTPDPKAGWSEWYRPSAVDPPYGVTPPAPLKSKLELRYKISIYGQ